MKKNLLLKSRKLHFSIGHFWGISILSLLAAFIIISCTKKEADLQEDLLVKNDITLHDGRLVFKDSITFINHVKWIHENQGNSREIVDKNCSMGFKSMTEYYKEGMKMEEDDPKFIEYVNNYPNVFYKVPFDNSTLYELPHSIVVCYCANKDGIFQVGKRIIRIGWGQVYMIHDGDETKIDMLFLHKDEINDKSISVTPSFSATKANNYGYATRKFAGDNRFRIVAKLWEFYIIDEYSGWVSWYDDAETIAQKKTLGVWFKANLNTKTVNDNGYFACDGCTPYNIYAGYDENNWESRINLVFTDTQIDMEESYCPVYHRGRYNYEYIYIYWPDGLDATPVADVTLTSPPF